MHFLSVGCPAYWPYFIARLSHNLNDWPSVWKFQNNFKSGGILLRCPNNPGSAGFVHRYPNSSGSEVVQLRSCAAADGASRGRGKQALQFRSSRPAVPPRLPQFRPLPAGGVLSTPRRSIFFRVPPRGSGRRSVAAVTPGAWLPYRHR